MYKIIALQTSYKSTKPITTYFVDNAKAVTNQLLRQYEQSVYLGTCSKHVSSKFQNQSTARPRPIHIGIYIYIFIYL